MGAIKKYLVKNKLKKRELHNSRLFVDLCENIHIHYREYRFVFSLDEFFEFADILEKSTKDIRNYLTQNPEYKEGKLSDVAIIAGGRDRQMKQLQNSPNPHTSKYLNDDLTIELQEAYVADEIHIHYRDFRLVLDRQKFKDLADAFAEAKSRLLEFEAQNNYQRRRHPDRQIINENLKKLEPKNLMGEKEIAVEKIKSYWFKDIFKDWLPERDYLGFLKNNISANRYVSPILVSQAKDGIYYIVDGHHRYLAHYELGHKKVSAIVLPFGFKQTEKLRRCEVLLKEIDRETHYEYRLLDFMKDYWAFKFNKHYRHHFKRKRLKYILRNAFSPNAWLFLRRIWLKIKDLTKTNYDQKQDN